MNRESLKSVWATLRATASRLHRDDRGAEALEKLLLVAVVVLPFVGVLIFFREQLDEWVRGNWEDIVAEGEVEDIVPGGGGTGGP